MIALIMCLIAALAGFALSPDMLTLRPKSPEVKLTLPAANLEPRLASLAGLWEVSRPGAAPSRVVIERITEAWATISYTWPDPRTDPLGEMWQRVTARVLPDAQLRWGFPVRFSLKASEGVGTLEICRATTGDRVTLKMKKVGTFLATADSSR